MMTPEYLDIPIFPLPNATLFPHTLMPLHIFEQRYRQMTENCIQGDRLMGIALLREGWQKNYFERPPIFKTFGVGKIVDYEALPEGRFNIVLQGIHRVRLVEEFPTDAYRTGRVKVLPDQAIDSKYEATREIMKTLRVDSEEIASLIPDMRDTIRSAWAAHPHPGVTADLLAASLVIDPYDRESILEEPNPLRRLQLVQVQLKNILFQFTQNSVREELNGEE